MSEQKRRAPRFDTDQKLWCEGQGAMAQARNMSVSGMFIVADDVLPVGEQLKVAFEGDEGRIEVNMEVMWSGGPSAQGRPGGMGVRIVSFDAGQKTYEKFVQKKLQEQRLDDAGAKARSSATPPAPR